VHFGPHGTAALDLDGNIVWRNSELKYEPTHGNGGSPALVDGLLAINCDGSDVQFAAALDQETGRIRWKVPRNIDRSVGAKLGQGFSFCTPLVIEVAGKKQLISAASNAVFAYDPRGGREIWHVNYPGGFSVVPRPVFGNGLLYVCTGYMTPTLLAIVPEGAKGDVTATHVAWKIDKAVPLNPSPLLVGEALYLIDDKGVASCHNARTGKPRWQKRVGGEYSASPLYADGNIYLQSEGGEGIVLKANAERCEELSRNSVEEKALASYAVGDGVLYVRSEKHLARIGGK
jgi:outer membrane protein assembly factor BamB